MSKERQRRREAAQREAAERAAARAVEAERAERRAARSRALTRWLPRPRRAARPSGVLAERRRQETGLLVAVLVTGNVLLWLFLDDWSARAMAAVVTLLVAPVLHALLVRG